MCGYINLDMNNSILRDRASRDFLLLNLDEEDEDEPGRSLTTILTDTSSSDVRHGEKFKVHVVDSGPLSRGVQKALRHRSNKKFVLCGDTNLCKLIVIAVHDQTTLSRYLEDSGAGPPKCVLFVGLHSQSSFVFEASRMIPNSDVLFVSKSLHIDAQELVFRMARLYRYVRACQHSAVLRDILPIHIISKLQQGVHSMYRKHNSVAVLFSDVVGYTSIASTWEPRLVLSMLHDMFATFDSICLKNKVFKVETIGDSYMVCVDCCESSASLLAIFETAVEMMQYVDTHIRTAFPSEVRVRIGIHSGMAYSGVVGLIRPRFCFFGDTVNTASRMESTAESGCIQISDTFYKDLVGSSSGAVDAISAKHSLQFATRQKMIKGKGNMVVHTMSFNETASSIT